MDKRLRVLCRNIRRFRLKADMSQDNLANRIGYKNRSTISKIESGQVDIGVTTLMDIANALDISVNQLLGIKEK